MADAFPFLLQLKLGSCKGVTDASCMTLSKLIRLQSLSLGDTSVTSRGLPYIAKLTALVVLSLSGTQISDAALQHVAQLPALEVLVLIDTNITNEGLKFLVNHPRLRPERVHVNRTKVTDEGLEAFKMQLLQNQANVKKGIPPALHDKAADAAIYQPYGDCFSIRGDADFAAARKLNPIVTNVEAQSEFVNNRTLTQMVEAFPLLLRFELGSCKHLTDSGCQSLSKLAKLQCLNLSNAQQISDAATFHIGSLTSLRELDLSLTSVGDSALQQLSQLNSLQVLNLSGNSNITDAGVPPSVANLSSSLRVLHLELTNIGDASMTNIGNLTSLQVLNLKYTNVSDVGMQHLAKLTLLRELYLQDTRIGDDGLMVLVNCSFLNPTNVYTSGTRVTAEGLEAFKQKLRENQVKVREEFEKITAAFESFLLNSKEHAGAFYNGDVSCVKIFEDQLLHRTPFSTVFAALILKKHIVAKRVHFDNRRDSKQQAEAVLKEAHRLMCSIEPEDVNCFGVFIQKPYTYILLEKSDSLL
jgi:Leucine-rich repeat (LRR) protein